MRILIAQVANDGRTPFDGLPSSGSYMEYPERLRRDLVRAEAMECGLIEDDATSDPTLVPDEVLKGLGITADEVDQ